MSHPAEQTSSRSMSWHLSLRLWSPKNWSLRSRSKSCLERRIGAIYCTNWKLFYWHSMDFRFLRISAGKFLPELPTVLVKSFIFFAIGGANTTVTQFTSIVDFTSAELDRKRFGKKWNRSLKIITTTEFYSLLIRFVYFSPKKCPHFILILNPQVPLLSL